MADKKEISRKLDELLKKSEQFQRDIKDLNEIILYSGILDEKPVQENIPFKEPVVVPPPQIILREDLPKEIVQENIPTVEPVIPVVIQTAKPVDPVEEKPVQQVLPKKEFDYIKESKKEEKPAEAAVTPPKKPTKKTFFEKNPDLEKFIGERLITFIGIAVLFTGIAFFVKYAIDKDWINETGRSFIGILSGGILIALAHRLRKNFRTFSSVLIGGGIAVEYFTITYAHHVYHMFPSQLAALSILVGITLFTVMLSVLYDRQELAVIAITGGFLTPLMVADGNGNTGALGAYITVLNVGMLALAYYKRWTAINFISYFFTIVLFGGALLQEFTNKTNPAYATAFIYSTVFYLVFFLMNIINNIKAGLKFSPGEIVVLLSNTMLYYTAGYYILNHLGEKSYHGLFTLGVAVFNFVFAFLLYKRQGIDRNLIYLLIGLVITFISLAGPIQLDGNNITLFWAAETVLLLWLYQRSKIMLLAYASMAVNVLMLGSLILSNWAGSIPGFAYYDFHAQTNTVQPFLLNRFFITSLFALVSLMATHFFLSRQKTDEIIPGVKMHAYKRFIGLSLLVIGYFSFFMECYTQMEIHGFTNDEKVICLSTYSAVFTAAFMAIVHFRKFDHLKAIASIMGVMVMASYLFFLNISVIAERNNLLMGTGSKQVYLLHYVLSAFVILIAVLLFREVKKAKPYIDLFNYYTWFVCILGVFMVSAEIDHLVIGSTYSGAAGDIEKARTMSANVAYPIAWGLCSFMVMVIGMRKQLRQLRIISLSLFAITIGKLIWLGINGGSEAGKIIAFISSGIVLMVVAFMYQKLKKLITEEDKPSENISHE